MLLGDKYDVLELREEGLSRLRAWYAEDIDQWDRRDDAFFVHDTDHLSVASITHALNEPTLHAAVLYHCAALSPTLLVAGAPAAGCPPLCTEDHIRMRTFTRRLPQAWRSFEFDEDAVPYSCCDDPRCYGIYVEEIRSEFDDVIGEKIDSCSSIFLDHAVWDALRVTCACSDCLSSYDEYLQDLRQRCRSKLPEYFGYVQPLSKQCPHSSPDDHTYSAEFRLGDWGH